MRRFFPFWASACLIFCVSCSSYRQNILFKAKDGQQYETLSRVAESNYRIQKNDLLGLEIFSPAEKVIDPMVENQNGNALSRENRTIVTYLVDINGVAKFPIVNELKVEGMTIREAEALLQKEYSRLYTDAFITLKYLNKRVVVLGTTNGTVVPLANDNMRLTEVLALSKAITHDAKAHNIRIIRDNKVFIANLTGITDYVNNDIIMSPNDIVYVEPVRRPFLEGARDYGALLSILTTLSALAIVIINTTN